MKMADYRSLKAHQYRERNLSAAIENSLREQRAHKRRAEVHKDNLRRIWRKVQAQRAAENRKKSGQD